LGDDDDVRAILGKRVAERLGPHPALVAVGQRHLRPAVGALADIDRIGEQHLRHLRRGVVGLVTKADVRKYA
jgi:hypothetical protein